MRSLPGDAVRFRLLGDIQAYCENRLIDLGHIRQRHVLAALLIDANQVVTTEQLIDRVWGQHPPVRSRNTLYTYLHRLRRTLDAGAGIVRRGGGYVFLVDPLAVDVHRFHDLVTKARSADLDAVRLDLMARAFDLWAAGTLAGPETPWFAQVREAMQGKRFAAELDYTDLRLRSGQYAEVAAELAGRITEHPFDERLAGQFMLALYGGGRQADALAHYDRVRAWLADELGVTPGPALRQLHQRILRTDPTLTDLGAARQHSPARARGNHKRPSAGDEAVHGSPPRQLPAAPRMFVGRERELDALLELAGDSAGVAVVVDGTAGVGKTSLAVHFAHRAAGRFPDGQLYLDLRGYATGHQMTPAEALGRLLRGLGVPQERAPVDVQEQAAAYRSLLAGKRVLVVLDNARSAEQVTPLLPGTPGCLVVITSRAALTTVDGATRVHVGTLAEAEALSLIREVSGPGRIEAEPEAAAAVVYWCAGLPLALRIVGARLLARPSWPVHALARQLADERHRLDELRVADLAIRSSFEISHRALAGSSDPMDRLAARAFRALGALDWVEMSVPVAQALLDLPSDDTHAALERLVDNHLLDSPVPGRYQIHDLLRLYSRELSSNNRPECEAAVMRVLICYVATAEHATRLLFPTVTRIADDPTRVHRTGFKVSTLDEAAEWFRNEQANLVTIARQTAAMPGKAPELTVRLTAALDPSFEVCGFRQDQITLRKLAADTAERIGDKAGEALAREDLGWAYTQVGRAEDAIDNLQRALEIHRQTGDHSRDPFCLNHLGFAYRQEGLLDEAIRCHEQGITSSRLTGDRRGESINLNNLGLVHQRLERFSEAISCHRQALEINTELPDHHGQAIAATNLGLALHRAGREDQAIAQFDRSLAITQAFGYAYHEAQALWGLAQARQALGEHTRASAHFQRAVQILDEIGELAPGEAGTLLEQPVLATPQVIQRNT